MKTHRIATIGHDSYILPESFSVEDSLRFLNFLSGCRKVSDRDYIPDKDSRYATSALVIDETPLEVAVKITAAPLMTREEYRIARDAGEAAYRAANANAEAASVAL